MATKQTHSTSWDLRAEFTKPGENQRESVVSGFGRGKFADQLVTEDGESVMSGDVDRLIITDGDDDHPQGRFVVAQVNWQASPAEQAANAKLFLAAPALLESLRELVLGPSEPGREVWDRAIAAIVEATLPA